MTQGQLIIPNHAVSCAEVWAHAPRCVDPLGLLAHQHLRAVAALQPLFARELWHGFGGASSAKHGAVERLAGLEVAVAGVAFGVGVDLDGHEPRDDPALVPQVRRQRLDRRPHRQRLVAVIILLRNPVQQRNRFVIQREV